MSEGLNVLCQSSDFYSPFCGVMLESLFYNNTDIETIKVYMISNGIGDTNLKKFDELSRKYGREIEIIDGSAIAERLKGYNMPEWHGSNTLYFKLLALDYIHEEMDRLLYLDSDMIVNGSLKELIEVDLKENIIGMAGGYINKQHIKNVKGLSGCNYNGGLILFDVNKWRKNDCTQRICNHLKNVQSCYSNVDEDVLNIVVKKFEPLDYKFNTGVPFLLINSRGGISMLNKIISNKIICSESEWENAYANPVILHYFNWLCKRPWYENSDSPMIDIWDKYMKMSPWKDIKKIKDNRPVANKIQNILFKLLPLKVFAFISRNITELMFYTADKRNNKKSVKHTNE